MGTIARGAKAGGGTNENAGQKIISGEVNTDFNTLYTEVNGLLDDANVETATMPGAKSFRFTEVTDPANPGADDILLYARDDSTRTRLIARDSAGNLSVIGGLGARGYNSANISIPNATSTALTFDTERYDIGAMHSTASNTSRLTITTPGVYLVTGRCCFAANATGNLRQIMIDLVGAETGRIASHSVPPIPGGLANTYMTIATLYKFSANDYVELTVHQDSGGNLNVLSGANDWAEFAIAMVGS